MTAAPTTTMTEASANQDELPNLTVEAFTKRNDRVDALKLVADSVAQQRQVASRILIFHPLCLAALAVFLAIGHYATAASGRSDSGAFIVSYGGIVLAYLITVRYFTGPYIHMTEETDWSQWLRGPDGAEDLVLGARYGDDVVGAVMLRLEPSTRNKGAVRSKAVIRAWTVKNRYRGKGLGSDLLTEAVVVAKKILGSDAEIEFAPDHANSALHLHSMFNAPFHARDARASKALAHGLAAWESK